MHSAIILLASAALLFSGAAAQDPVVQDCDPAETPAEPPCPYGHWCPGSGICPPNPCLDFPCVHGRCELTKPDDGPQGTQLPAPHTPMCVCDEHFHCANGDCFVSNSCVPDVSPPPPPCCQDAGCECGCTESSDGKTCTCDRCPQPCDDVTCPAHSHMNPDATTKEECCACNHNWCGPAGSNWMPGSNEGFCGTHSKCCDVSCSQHGQCYEDTGSCVCDWVIPPADLDHPHGMHPAWMGSTCEFLDPCREKNCGSHGRCETPPTAISPPDAPVCEDCIETHCKCDKCFSGDGCEVRDSAEECCAKDDFACGDHGTVQASWDSNGNLQCSCVCTDCFTGEHCDVPWDMDNKCKECVDNVVQPTCHCDCGHGNPATGHCDCLPNFFGESCDQYDACTNYNCGSHGRCLAHEHHHEVKFEQACEDVVSAAIDWINTKDPAKKCDDWICGSSVSGSWAAGAVCFIEHEAQRLFHTDLCEFVVEESEKFVTDVADGICKDIFGDKCHPKPHQSCECDPGFTGEFCETDLCFGKVCGSHGLCKHTEEFPGTCECSDGWTGERCEIAPPNPYVDPCQPSDANPDGWTCNGHGQCGADPDDESSPKCDCDAGWCGDHCDILEWKAAVSGGVFTDPGSTSAGQRAAVGVVGMAAAAVIVKRRMALAVAPAGETIYAPQV